MFNYYSKLLIFFLFFGLSGHFSKGQILQEVLVNPPTPTVNDYITLTLNGLSFSSAIQLVDKTISINGNQISANLYFVNSGVGLPFLNPFSHNLDVGYLAPGTYTVNAMSYLDGDPNLPMTITFTVSGSLSPKVFFTHYTLNPAVPISGDAVTVTLHGYTTEGNVVLTDSSHVYIPNTLSIKLNYTGSGGPDVITPFSYNYYLGPLTEGFYNVTAQGFLDGLSQGVKDTTFEVITPPGQAYIYLDSLKHNPQFPNNQDNVSLKLQYYTFYTNVEYDNHTIDIVGNQIKVKAQFKDNGTQGEPLVGEHTLDIPVGTLPAGFYTAIVEGNYEDLYAGFVKDTFTVIALPSPNEIYLNQIVILPNNNPTTSDFIVLKAEGYTNKPSFVFVDQLYTKNDNVIELDLYFNLNGNSEPQETPFSALFYSNQLPAGYYTVTARANYNSVVYATIDTFFIVGQITDINSTGNLPEMSITAYPNPVQDQLHLHYTLDTPEPLQLSLFDVTGRKVLAQVLPTVQRTGTFTLDTSTLPAGVYTYQITTQQHSSKPQKIVIQH